MNKKNPTQIPSFLLDSDNLIDPSLILKLNIILSGIPNDKKPYKIDYNTLLMSYNSWKGDSLEEFCHKQTLSYFLFNPNNDSAEAREAMYMEIMEFLSGK